MSSSYQSLLGLFTSNAVSSTSDILCDNISALSSSTINLNSTLVPGNNSVNLGSIGQPYNTVYTSNLVLPGLSNNQVVVTGASSNLTTQAMSDGQLLIGNGGGFISSTLTQGSNIVVTNSPGAITIAISDNPTFNTVILNTSLTNNGFYNWSNSSYVLGSLHYDIASFTGSAPLNDTGANFHIDSGSTSKNCTVTFSKYHVSTQYLGVTSTGSYIGSDGATPIIFQTGINYTANTVLGSGTTRLTIASTGVITTGSGNILDNNAGLATFGNIIDSGLTASQLVATNASKQLISQSCGTQGQLLIGNSLSAGTYALGNINAGVSTNLTAVYTTPNIVIDIISSPTFTGTITANSLILSGAIANQLLATNNVNKLISVPLSSGQVVIGDSGSYTPGAILPGVSANLTTTFISPNIIIDTISNPTFSGLVTAGNIIDNGLTIGQLVTVNSSKQLISQSSGTQGQLLIGNSVSAGTYALGNINPGSNLTVTYTSPNITISTVSNPTFAGTITANALILSGATPNQLLATNASNQLTSIPLASGQLVIGNSGSFLSGNINSGSSGNINVTFSSPNIVIDTTSNPIFTGLLTAGNIVDSGLNKNQLVGTNSSKQLINYVINAGLSSNQTVTTSSGVITVDVVPSPTFTNLSITGHLELLQLYGPSGSFRFDSAAVGHNTTDPGTIYNFNNGAFGQDCNFILSKQSQASLYLSQTTTASILGSDTNTILFKTGMVYASSSVATSGSTQLSISGSTVTTKYNTLDDGLGNVNIIGNIIAHALTCPLGFQTNALAYTDASKNLLSTTVTNGQFLIGKTGSSPTVGTILGASGNIVTSYSSPNILIDITPTPAFQYQYDRYNSTFSYSVAPSTYTIIPSFNIQVSSGISTNWTLSGNFVKNTSLTTLKVQLTHSTRWSGFGSITPCFIQSWFSIGSSVGTVTDSYNANCFQNVYTGVTDQNTSGSEVVLWPAGYYINLVFFTNSTIAFTVGGSSLPNQSVVTISQLA